MARLRVPEVQEVAARDQIRLLLLEQPELQIQAVAAVVVEALHLRRLATAAMADPAL